MDEYAAHLSSLEERGFTVVAQVLSAEELEFLRDALDVIYAQYDPVRDGLQGVEGYRFATNLVDKGPFFESIFLRAPIYTLAQAILGDDCILSSLNTLEPLPGQGNQGLHRDVGTQPSQGLVSINTLWIIDDTDRGNGATRVVPFSHKIDDVDRDSDAPAQYVEGMAGSVIVINAHLLHAASANTSGRRRRIMHGYFTQKGQPQQLDQKKYISPEVQRHLSPQARAVLALDD